MEGIAANAGHTLGDHHAGQAAATVEGSPVDAGYAIRNRHAGQTAATVEGIVANTSHAIRNRHAGQTAATVEGMAANTSHAIWNRHAGQAAATVEGIAVNAGHAIWNRHAGQAAAAVEGRAADACHALRNLHRCQLGAVLKGGLTDRFNATGQAYGSQLQARVKGIVTDAFYARLHHCRQNLGSVGIPRGYRGVGIILHLPAAGNGQRTIHRKYPCQIIPIFTALAGSNHVPVIREQGNVLHGFLGGFLSFLCGLRGRRGFLGRRGRFLRGRFSGCLRLHDGLSRGGGLLRSLGVRENRRHQLERHGDRHQQSQQFLHDATFFLYFRPVQRPKNRPPYSVPQCCYQHTTEPRKLQGIQVKIVQFYRFLPVPPPTQTE